MNDGVRLDAALCTPAGDTPGPAVVLVHGHGEDGSKASTLARAQRLSARGYTTLAYSVRGQGGSEGLSFHLGMQELVDLQTVVAWVQSQPAVDPARVAVCGSSQGGWHSWMAAAHIPGLATAVPENIFVDYADFAVPQGALSTWFFTRTMRRRVMSAGLQDLARQWAIDGDWFRLRTWLQPLSPRVFADRIRCPVMVVHGWHDVGMPANRLIEMFEALQVPKRLILGGGGHDGQDESGAAAWRTDQVDAWLDHWLMGSDLPDAAPIVYARRPGWDHVQADTLQHTQSQTLYLRHGGTLAADAPDAPTPNSNVNHRTRDGSYTLAVALAHDLEGSAAAWPREEVAFDSDPVTEDLDIVGIPRFVLHVLPSRPWYQIHAELFDVAPDGTATLISRGHAGSQTATPGRHLRLEIAGRAVAVRLAAGHRVRVVVADQRPAYVVPVYRPWRARLYHETDHCSCVVLPLQ